MSFWVFLLFFDPLNRLTMAYNETLADRIRQSLSKLPDIVEKKMMGGLTFMYRDKMCVGIIKDELMCRIDPAKQDECIQKKGCRPMDFTKKPMKGYIMVDQKAMHSQDEFEAWIQLTLEYNDRAKSSKKKKL